MREGGTFCRLQKILKQKIQRGRVKTSLNERKAGLPGAPAQSRPVEDRLEAMPPDLQQSADPLKISRLAEHCLPQGCVRLIWSRSSP